jgi:acetoin utilization protein AcuB
VCLWRVVIFLLEQARRVRQLRWSGWCRGCSGRVEARGRLWPLDNPVTANPTERLSSIKEKFDAGNFRSIPVVSSGKLVGVVTDRDLRLFAGKLADTEASDVIAAAPPSVTPDTSLHKAAQLLKEHKLDSLPVIEDERLVGIITTTDVLGALND